MKIVKTLLVMTMLISTQSIAASPTQTTSLCRMDFRSGGFQFITCLAGIFR